MKTIQSAFHALLYISLLFLPQQIFAQTWTQINQRVVIHAFQFVNTTTGWAVGSSGKIFHTTDGGNNWLRQESGTSAQLNSVSFIDNNYGWVAGGESMLLRTSDGGANWDYQMSITPNDYQCIFFKDKMNGWALDSYGSLLHTTNNGELWKTVVVPKSGEADIPVGFASFSFVTAKVGWAIRGGNSWRNTSKTIVRTTDGGITWYEQLSDSRKSLLSVKFNDLNNGWVVGDSGLTLHTTDGGRNWRSHFLGMKQPLSTIFFSDNDNGWTTNGDEWIHTTDCGVTWNNEIFSAGLPPRKVAQDRIVQYQFFDSSNGWILGESGNLYKTTNSGTDWKNGVYSPAGTITGISFTDSLHGFLVTSDGTGAIMHTTDGGLTWHLKSYGDYSNANNLSFLDKQNGWISKHDGTIIRTSDGGETWVQQEKTVTKLALNKIAFVTQLIGWSFDESGTIYKTTDGGVSWNIKYYTPQKTYLTDISIRSNNDVLFVGFFRDFPPSRASSYSEDQMIYKAVMVHSTNDGHDWSTTQTDSIRKMTSIYFVDDSTGWIGCDKGKVLHTTDGGLNWQQQNTGLNRSISQFQFVDRKNGWGKIGEISSIVHTTDGGATWKTEFSVADYLLRKIFFVDANHGWAVGENGLIFKYSPISPK